MARNKSTPRNHRQFPKAKSTTSAQPVGAPIESRLAGHARLRDIVVSFVDRLPERIDRMAQCLEQGNLQEVAEISHWLKGSAGSVGFDDFTEPARELEAAAKGSDQKQTEHLLTQIQSLSSRVVAPGQVETDESKPGKRKNRLRARQS